MARSRAYVTFSRKPGFYALASAYPEAVRNEVLAAQEDNARDLERTAHAELDTGARHGRLYTDRHRTHLASAASEPPATDTGKLDASLRGFTEPEFLSAALEAKGRDVVPLEFGSRKMAARPFLGRAAFMVLKRARQRIGSAVKRAARAVAP